MLIIIILITLVHARYVFVYTKTPCINRVDKEFDEEKEMFGVGSLKEFIDGYESSRFTQISETEAIITSEYNMNHIVDWIERFAEDMVYS